MAAASMQSACALTQPTVIGDCGGWRSAQRELVQASLAPATQTRARRSRFVCRLDSPTHDLAASGNSSEVGAEPNPCQKRYAGLKANLPILHLLSRVISTAESPALLVHFSASETPSLAETFPLGPDAGWSLGCQRGAAISGPG